MDLTKQLKERGVTKAEMSRKMGVTWNTVNNWCNTEWKRLSYTTRERICKLLEVEVC